MNALTSSAPLVSVVIPTYNHAGYLADAIQSVFSQTYTNWELFVIDNYSTDATDTVLAQFRSPRMTVLKVHNNGSIAVSRNIGYIQAHGEWVAFLDSDDYWTEDKLVESSKYFIPSVDLIYHNLKVLNEMILSPTTEMIKSRKVKSPVFYDLLFKGNTVATSSVVVRKSMLDKIGGMCELPEMTGTEDYNTWLKISKQTEGFKHIGKALGFYRLHKANISNVKAYAPPRAAIAEFVDTLSKKEQQKLELIYVYSSGRLNYLSGNHSEAKISLDKVIRSKYPRYALKALWMLSVGRVLVIVRKFPTN